MDSRMYRTCCRLCLDDTREQVEICSDKRLTEILHQLYNVKVEATDICTKKICVECFKETNEMQTWLKLYEEQKKLIAENQRIFNEELINQFGPDETVQASPPKSARSRRTARRSLQRTDDEDEELGEKDEDFIPKKNPRIKKEYIKTRLSIKKEWLPRSDGSGQESSTPTEHASGDDDEEDDSETATSTTDDDLKCPKCERAFAEIDQLERHSCEFVCSICSATLRYRHGLKRHLMGIHKIKADQWQQYWSPVGDSPDDLLVATSKPKKRYRYESDSPTDIDEDSTSENGSQPKDLVCSRCGDKFDTSRDLKTHECDYMCNICGTTFASRNNVRRHKLRVHSMDAKDLSRATSVSRTGSRPPSRAPSTAASEHPSDDEPLAALATKKSGPDFSEDYRQRFFCPDCDYSNYKRNKITQHLINYHRTPKEQIDVEAIPKQLVPKTAVYRSRSKTPVKAESIAHRSKTPKRATPITYGSKTPTKTEPMAHRSQTPNKTEPIAYRSKTPSSTEPVANRAKTPILIAYRSKTPDHSKTVLPVTTESVYQLATAVDHESVAKTQSSQHRSRSRSIHQDSRNSSKRKRSLSACSNKSSRQARSRSNPPVDRNILVAKRRISPVRALAKVSEKLRPTITGIESNRLFISINQSCEDLPANHQFRIRATSHITQEPCPTRRLFKLKPPIATERQLAQKLRGVFSNLSYRISSQSKVNAIDIDSLVLDFVHPPKPETQKTAPTNNDQELQHEAEMATFEIREVGSEETTQVVVAGHDGEVLETQAFGNPEHESSVADSLENGTVPVEVTGNDDVALLSLPEKVPATEEEEHDSAEQEGELIIAE